MFKIKHIAKDNTINSIEISNLKNNTFAKLNLKLGGSLQVLTLNNNEIIKDLHPLNYNESYASSILFPFANRVENGIYTFNERQYKLDLNSKENNAIHGLVFNKYFELSEQQIEEDYAKITLKFDETNITKGYPFKYSIFLTYTFFTDSISLDVKVINTDKNQMPFNIGWHPYFYSKDLYNSILEIESDKILIFNKDMIPVKIEDNIFPEKISIKDYSFDDCFILNKNYVRFKTPYYKLRIESSAKENYLQLFTPEKENTIAIEPKTGPSNSFNNRLGLQTLNPNESYSVKWKITLE